MPDKIISRYVSTKKQYPNYPHWAILHFEQVSIPGYGDRDPWTTETVIKHEIFDNENDWKTAVTRLEESDIKLGSYTAVYIVPAKVSRSVKVELTSFVIGPK